VGKRKAQIGKQNPQTPIEKGKMAKIWGPSPLCYWGQTKSTLETWQGRGGKVVFKETKSGAQGHMSVKFASGKKEALGEEGVFGQWGKKPMVGRVN